MKTQILTRTLRFNDIVWTIDVNIPISKEERIAARTPDEVRSMPPDDPWSLMPIAHDSTGRALYSPTVLVPIYSR